MNLKRAIEIGKSIQKDEFGYRYTDKTVTLNDMAEALNILSTARTPPEPVDSPDEYPWPCPDCGATDLNNHSDKCRL